MTKKRPARRTRSALGPELELGPQLELGPELKLSDTPPAPCPELPAVEDAVTVVIRGVSVDLCVARTTYEQVERQHRMPETGNYVPSTQFILDAAQALREVGVTDCTPTDALTKWYETWAKYSELKKKHPYMQS